MRRQGKLWTDAQRTQMVVEKMNNKGEAEKKVAGRGSTTGSLKEKSVPQDLCFYCQAALINGLPSSSQPAA